MSMASSLSGARLATAVAAGSVDEANTSATSRLNAEIMVNKQIVGCRTGPVGVYEPYHVNISTRRVIF